MNETMSWIATHLDYYHFNSDRARLLKRQIQEWSTLSAYEQDQKADILLERFFELFANNPWLEQNRLTLTSPEDGGYVLSRMNKKPCCGEITGACSDAYFVQCTHYSVKPYGLDCNYFDSAFLNAENQRRLLSALSGAANREKKKFASQVKDALACFDERYEYILKDNLKIGDRTVKSPTLLGVVICFLYLIATYQFIVTAIPALFSKGDIYFPLDMVDLPGRVWWIISLVVIIAVWAVWGKEILNTMIKGAYRRYYLSYAKKYKDSMNVTIGTVDKMNVMPFFDSYREQLEKAKELYCSGESVLKKMDPTRSILKPQKEASYLDLLCAQKAPWTSYSKTGENQSNLIWGILILTIVMLYIILEMKLLF